MVKTWKYHRGSNLSNFVWDLKKHHLAQLSQRKMDITIVSCKNSKGGLFPPEDTLSDKVFTTRVYH